jgi:hypothetical protein
MLVEESSSPSTQNERRGRFLIQEVEEEISIIKKASVKGVKMYNKQSKKTKHSSIMDSKIIHTEIVDSTSSNGHFSTFIFEEDEHDWIDFESVWKEFSKRSRCQILENEMEKIFHYVDHRMDHENDSIKQIIDREEINGLRSNFKKNEIVLEMGFDENKCFSKNQSLTPFFNDVCNININKINEKLLKPRKSSYQNKRKNLVLSNICDVGNIPSPQFSPIVLEKQNRVHFNVESKILLERSAPKNSNEEKIVSEKTKFDHSTKKILNSEKLKKTQKFQEFENVKNFQTLAIKKPMMIEIQFQFTLIAFKNNFFEELILHTPDFFYINSQQTSENPEEENRNCSACRKNVI